MDLPFPLASKSLKNHGRGIVGVWTCQYLNLDSAIDRGVRVELNPNGAALIVFFDLSPPRADGVSGISEMQFHAMTAGLIRSYHQF